MADQRSNTQPAADAGYQVVSVKARVQDIEGRSGSVTEGGSTETSEQRGRSSTPTEQDKMTDERTNTADNTEHQVVSVKARLEGRSGSVTEVGSTKASEQRGRSSTPTKQDKPSTVQTTVTTVTDSSGLEYHTGGSGLNICGQKDDRTGYQYNIVNQYHIQDSSSFHVGNITHHHHYPGTPIAQTDPSPQTDLDTLGDSKRVKADSDLFRSFCREKIQEVFVETTQCRRAKEIIGKANTLVIMGHSGYGKTSLLRYISVNSPLGYLPIACQTTEEIKTCIDRVKSTNIKLLIVVDEPFGGSFKQRKLVHDWINIGNTLEMYLGMHKVVFATRTYVWNDCKVHFRDSPLFCNRLDIDPIHLTLDDRCRLLKKYLGEDGRLTDAEVEHIVSIENQIAYCQCCKLMGDAIKTGQSGNELVKIFEKPFFYLFSELRKMADEEEVKYVALVLLMLCGGNMKCRELTGTYSDVTPDVRERIDVVRETYGCKDLSCANLRDCMDNLTGTFLERVHEIGISETSELYTFAHDSIREAVTMDYGKRHFRHFLKFVHEDIIVKIIRPQNYEKDEHEFVISCPDDAENTIKLVEVFTEAAIGEGWGLMDVFQNPFVRQPAFQDVWCEYLESSNDQLETFIQSKSLFGTCLLTTSLGSGSVILHSYLSARGVKCTCCSTINSPLSLAASRNDAESVRKLLSTQKQTEDQLCQAVVSSCEHGSLNVLKMLLPKLTGGRHNETIDKGMNAACLYGRIATVKYLLETSYNPCKGVKCGCMRALRRASSGGCTDIVDVLVCHGAGVNARGNDGTTCLQRAVARGHTRIVRKLVMFGSQVNNIDIHGRSCLHYAAEMGHIINVRELLTHGVEINITDKYGYTCLHCAVLNGHTETVRELINHGAGINITDNKGRSCLHCAVIQRREEIVRYLLSQGAFRTMRDETSSTARQIAVRHGWTIIVAMLDDCSDLHVAAGKGRMDDIRTMVTKGADLHNIDANGRTCLHWAAEFGQIDTVRELIAMGVDINIRNDWDETALDLANTKGYTIISEMLRTH